MALSAWLDCSLAPILLSSPRGNRQAFSFQIVLLLFAPPLFFAASRESVYYFRPPHKFALQVATLRGFPLWRVSKCELVACKQFTAPAADSRALAADENAYVRLLQAALAEASLYFSYGAPPPSCRAV